MRCTQALLAAGADTSLPDAEGRLPVDLLGSQVGWGGVGAGSMWLPCICATVLVCTSQVGALVDPSSRLLLAVMAAPWLPWVASCTAAGGPLGRLAASSAVLDLTCGTLTCGSAAAPPAQDSKLRELLKPGARARAAPQPGSARGSDGGAHTPPKSAQEQFQALSEVRPAAGGVGCMRLCSPCWRASLLHVRIFQGGGGRS